MSQNDKRENIPLTTNQKNWIVEEKLKNMDMSLTQQAQAFSAEFGRPIGAATIHRYWKKTKEIPTTVCSRLT